jgi:hypothetical protein
MPGLDAWLKKLFPDIVSRLHHSERKSRVAAIPSDSFLPFAEGSLFLEHLNKLQKLQLAFFPS